MRLPVRLALVVLTFWAGEPALAGGAAPAARLPTGTTFTAGPKVARHGNGLKIAFTVSDPADVEVAILDASGKVVRHLAAGVLGGEHPPPAPLVPGLAQTLLWDGNDDLKTPATGGPFRVRVRAGLGARFDRFLGGDDPYWFGQIDSMATDGQGRLYLIGFRGFLGLDCMSLRVFDPQGRYLRTLMPFPADLPPDAMKDIARWSEPRHAFIPRNQRTINPAMYPGVSGRGGSALRLVAASARDGVLLTNGHTLFRLDARGAVAGATFAERDLWPEDGQIKNSGRGPVYLAASPDGKAMYLAGPFSSKTRYGHKFDPRFPPGRIYRMPLDGPGTMEEFVTIEVAHDEGQGGAWYKELGLIRPGYYDYRPRGPVHGIAVDADGRLYAADREHHRVVVFNEAGKEVGQVSVACPDQIALHPKTGALYVLAKARVKPREYQVKVLKFKTVCRGAGPAASCDLRSRDEAVHMALQVSGDRTVVWVAGAPDGLTALADTGEAFEPVRTEFAPRPDTLRAWTRLAVDYDRDEVYCNDGAVDTRRYSGSGGTGVRLTKDGRPLHVADLAVGYDGLLYARVYAHPQHRPGGGFSGPLWRMDRDLDPAPYEQTGTHVLSGHIYGRYGHGYADRGIGVAPDGAVYTCWLYKWADYWVTGFGPDGRPMKGKYLAGKGRPDLYEKGTPKALNSAIIGPMPAGNGGLRVGLDGHIYIGLWAWPKDVPVPEAFAADPAYVCGTGSVFKFTPQGGFLASDRWSSVETVERTPGAAGIEVRSGAREARIRDKPPRYNTYSGFLQGAVAAYPGLAPFSHASYAGNTCCVCRAPRFDLDRYGRLYIPNAFTNSVRVVDNAGNLVLEFGRYGNFDSGYVNANLPQGRAGEPTVAVPRIPLAWPAAAGVSENHVYVCDSYNLRAVRVALTWDAETVCGVE